MPSMSAMELKNALNLDLSQQQAFSVMLTIWQSILATLPASLQKVQYLLAKEKLTISLSSLEMLLFEVRDLIPQCVSITKFSPSAYGEPNTVLNYINLEQFLPIENRLSSKENLSVQVPTKVSQITNVDELLSEAMNDVSVANDNEKILLHLLNFPTALEVLSRENALMQEAVPYMAACPFSARECSKARAKTCNKIHFQSIIRSNTDVSLGDCSYLNTCFKGKNCRYVHYHISLPESNKVNKVAVRPGPVIQPLGIAAESMFRAKVCLIVEFQEKLS